MHLRANYSLLVQERRRAQRFDFELPILVRWKRGAEMMEAHSASENISSKGIYFSLSRGIREFTAIEIVMTLPNQITLAGPSGVRCFGQVQRCEWVDATCRGIAAAFEKIEFFPSNENASTKQYSFTFND